MENLNVEFEQLLRHIKKQAHLLNERSALDKAIEEDPILQQVVMGIMIDQENEESESLESFVGRSQNKLLKKVREKQNKVIPINPQPKQKRKSFWYFDLMVAASIAVIILNLAVICQVITGDIEPRTLGQQAFANDQIIKPFDVRSLFVNVREDVNGSFAIPPAVSGSPARMGSIYVIDQPVSAKTVNNNPVPAQSDHKSGKANLKKESVALVSTKSKVEKKNNTDRKTKREDNLPELAPLATPAIDAVVIVVDNDKGNKSSLENAKDFKDSEEYEVYANSGGHGVTTHNNTMPWRMISNCCKDGNKGRRIISANYPINTGEKLLTFYPELKFGSNNFLLINNKTGLVKASPYPWNERQEWAIASIQRDAPFPDDARASCYLTGYENGYKEALEMCKALSFGPDSLQNETYSPEVMMMQHLWVRQHENLSRMKLPQHLYPAIVERQIAPIGFGAVDQGMKRESYLAVETN